MRSFVEHTLSGALIGVVCCFVIVNATITETSLNTNTEYFARLIALKVGASLGAIGGAIYSLCGDNSNTNYSATMFKHASNSSGAATHSLPSPKARYNQ